ncbi:MAG: hypothetical protein ACD_75C01274G0001, partial [uncultured bacterium]
MRHLLSVTDKIADYGHLGAAFRSLDYAQKEFLVRLQFVESQALCSHYNGFRLLVIAESKKLCLMSVGPADKRIGCNLIILTFLHRLPCFAKLQLLGGRQGSGQQDSRGTGKALLAQHFLKQAVHVGIIGMDLVHDEHAAAKAEAPHKAVFYRQNRNQRLVYG